MSIFKRSVGKTPIGKEKSCFHSAGMQRIAWFTLLLQLFIPLSTSFSPLISAVYAANNAAPANVLTVPYVLGSGETTEAVAKKGNASN